MTHRKADLQVILRALLAGQALAYWEGQDEQPFINAIEELKRLATQLEIELKHE